LILDIFAQRAKTKEGKLQVELAQCMYVMPRLVGQWGHFSRLGGGIGTRGPGETQLEVDRRRLRERIHHLKEKLIHVQEYRDLHRHKRQGVPVPTIAMVGYTNAGKSTLMNSLTEAGVVVEDKLFATLDPTVRRLRLPSGRQVLLSDTVGFIRKLPHQLVKAFKATFEEVRAADVLLHVVDMSSPTWQQQKAVVEKVLEELGLHSKPRLEVLNKVDLIGNGAACFNGLRISAREGIGVDHLLDQIETKLREGCAKVYLKIPYQASQCLDWLHQVAEIHRRDFKKDGIYLQVSLSPENADRIRDHQIKVRAKHSLAPTGH
jgi:GTP-binding protein HflX